jgi:AcrR family transcriptional regulator
VFADLGYHGATTQKIADVLRIRQASLYYYFPSKEAALELVCAQGVAGYFETAEAIASGPGTAAERLAALVRAHISPVVDRGNFVRVFLTQRQFLPKISRRRVGRWSRGIEQMFESVVRQGIKTRDFRADIDPRLATLAILGMSNAVMAWYSKENTSIERIGQNFIRLTLNGLKAGPVPRRKGSERI